MTVSPIQCSLSSVRLQVEVEIPNARASLLPAPEGRLARHATTSSCWIRAIFAEIGTPPGGHGA